MGGRESSRFAKSLYNVWPIGLNNTVKYEDSSRNFARIDDYFLSVDTMAVHRS